MAGCSSTCRSGPCTATCGACSPISGATYSTSGAGRARTATCSTRAQHAVRGHRHPRRRPLRLPRTTRSSRSTASTSRFPMITSTRCSAPRCSSTSPHFQGLVDEIHRVLKDRRTGRVHRAVVGSVPLRSLRLLPLHAVEPANDVRRFPRRRDHAARHRHLGHRLQARRALVPEPAAREAVATDLRTAVDAREPAARRSR